MLHRGRARIDDHARGVRELAATGDPLFTRLVQDGVIDGLDRAMAQLRQDAATFEAGT